jgi:DNA-binding XRE family transcriptional regulator
MSKERTYSQYTIEAIHLLSDQIKLGRKQHKWSEHDLADRAGISRATLQKIEKGNMNCAIGLFFEVATLVGVKLFETEKMSLAIQQERIDDKLALLPKAIRKKKKIIHDDF